MQQRIVVAHDLTELSDRALVWAAVVAREWGSALTVLHVGFAPRAFAPDPALMAIPPPSAEELAATRARLQRLVDGCGVADATVETSVGHNVGATLVERARSLDAGLIVLGTHGLGSLARAVLGSVADHVVRHADCPVATIRGLDATPAAPDRWKILVAYDFSSAADRAVQWTAGFARGGAAVTLLHVVTPTAGPGVPSVVPVLVPSTPQDLAALRRQLDHVAERHGLHASSTAARHADAGPMVVTQANAMGADLIVIGTRGRGGVRRALLGSVADYVVRQATCPVVTVRETTRAFAMASRDPAAAGGT